jgi:SAM-dependent methyltransferase
MTQDNTQRFTNKSDNYVKYRPHYPKEIIPFLVKTIGLTQQFAIADLGSGTGISTELFINNGNRVYAIEPNRDMRQAAEVFFKGNPLFKSVDATAENTTLDAHSIDLILAGQAFHWFDKSKTKEEARRILKPNHYFVVLYNDRDTDTPFQYGYENVLNEYQLIYDKIKEREIALKQFFSPSGYDVKQFKHSRLLDLEGVLGLFKSSSYIPEKSDKRYPFVMEKITKVFNANAKNGLAELAYKSTLYYGRLT